MKATFNLEKKLWPRKCVVIGIDEVGRGALAGPLTVGAVCFKPNWMNDDWKTLQKIGIQDSKILSRKKREDLCIPIKEYALAHSTASSTVEDIDEHGITWVTCTLFNIVVQNVLDKLPKDLTVFVLVDGKIIPPFENVEKDAVLTVIDGDAKSISIAAASIIAKVDRDRQMTHLAKDFPHYRWELNKGYGTKLHIEALHVHGASFLHRKKFIDGIIL